MLEYESIFLQLLGLNRTLSALRDSLLLGAYLRPLSLDLLDVCRIRCSFKLDMPK